MPADSSASSGAPSSTAEIARATARRSADSTPSTTAATSIGGSAYRRGRREPGRRSGSRDRLQRAAERPADRPLSQERRIVLVRDLRTDHRQVQLLALEAPKETSGPRTRPALEGAAREPPQARALQDRLVLRRDRAVRDLREERFAQPSALALVRQSQGQDHEEQQRQPLGGGGERDHEPLDALPRARREELEQR